MCERIDELMAISELGEATKEELDELELLTQEKEADEKKTYAFLVDIDGVEEVHSGEVEAVSLEEARKKVNDLIMVSIIEPEED